MQNNFYGNLQQPQYNFNNGFPSINNSYEIIAKAKRNIKSHSIRIGICILVFLASPYVLSLMLNIFGIFDLYLNNLVFQYAIELLYSVVFLFLPFFIIYKTESKENKAKIEESFEKPKSSMLFFSAIGFGLMLCYCGDYISTWIAAFFEVFGITLTTTAEVVIPTSGVELLLFFISTAIAPALIEEFTMRAVTMQRLRRYGDTFAIIMTALVFGLMHRNAVQGIFAFIAGIVFGYISVLTNSVWTAVVVHSINNALYVVLNVVNVLNPTFFETVYPLILILIFVIGIICAIPFVLSSKRVRLHKAPLLPKLRQKTQYFLLTVPMILSIVWMLVYTLFIQI